jgi:CheY-like chemotaxis protein
MRPAQIEELLERMDFNQASNEAASGRSFVRWCIKNINAGIELEDNGRFRSKIMLVGRNLSNSGISVLHSSFFYPNTRCKITLPRKDAPGQTSVIEGCIMWCTHVEGLVHEIGIKFDAPIDSSAFVTKMMSDKRNSASTNHSELDGRVLLVEDSLVDRKLIEHFVSETKIDLTFAETLAQAREKISEPFDLILCDLMMPDGNGIDFIKWIRNQSITIPVAINSSTPANQVQSSMTELGVQGFIAKPIDKANLLTAMTEFLSMKDQSGSNDAAVLDTSDPEIQSIVDLFKNELKEIVTAIESQIQNDDTMPIYTAALRLQGMAPSLGFGQLGKIAGRTAESLAATMSCEESKQQLDAFLESCRSSAAAA